MPVHNKTRPECSPRWPSDGAQVLTFTWYSTSESLGVGFWRTGHQSGKSWVLDGSVILSGDKFEDLLTPLTRAWAELFPSRQGPWVS
jgi:hypothetical protein